MIETEGVEPKNPEIEPEQAEETELEDLNTAEVEPAPAETAAAAEVKDKVVAVIDPSRLVFQASMKNSMSVRWLQAVLYEAGYRGVSADRPGWYSTGTQEAVQAFQAGAGLPETGRADMATLEALFSESDTYTLTILSGTS
jgi:peptidoglycan hydrolase-like protein with peptidoglycan-binding domain